MTHPAGATLAPQPPKRYGGPVVRHTHIHTFAHTQMQQMQQHTHKTVLQRSWCPGLAGVPLTEPNYGAFLSELDLRLLKAHNTMAAVLDKSRAHTQQQLSLLQQDQDHQQQQQQQHHQQHHRQPQSQPPPQLQCHQQQHLPDSQGGPSQAGRSTESSWSVPHPRHPHSQPQRQQQQQQQPGMGREGPAAASLAAVERQDLDTVALRRAVNVSLAAQMEFATSCMASWCSRGRFACACPTCGCSAAESAAARQRQALLST
ncbi:MAG: hypothetical protein WDW38_006076 [Sanguina aurantia]